MPLVKLLKTHTIGAPGDKIVAFGHEFTIEPDGSCTCDMHQDFIDAEVSAGRIEVIDDEFEDTLNSAPDETPDEINRKPIHALASFGMNMSDYFGTNNMSVFMGAVKQLLKEDLKLFAQTRLQLTFPARHTNEQMIEEIKEMVSLAHKKDPA